MSIATLIRRMAEAGAPPEAIALAVEEIEAVQTSLDARRLADRDRKRDQRERQKSANVTGQSEDSPETVTPMSDERVSLDKEIPPRPPKEINPIPCVNTRARLGYHRLPEGWQPTKALPEQLQTKVDQWPPGAFEDEVAAFKRWAANAENKDGKGRKLDWDKALWNWLGRQHNEHSRRTNRMAGHQSNDGLSSTARAAIAVFGAPSAGRQ